jgi:hypothetical protein
MYSRQDLIWEGNELRLFSSGERVLAAIKPDQIWLDMRLARLLDGRPTDMANLSRAKDSAASLALAVPNWHREAA